MQKIKLSVFDRMLEARLTGAEINFILYISHYQDDTGQVLGVYYRDVCEGIRISPQTFYEVMNGLREKGLIETEKDYYGDWDVRILGNDFSYEGANGEGYISTGHDIFHDPEFYRLKARAKLLAMHILKIAGAGYGRFHMGADRFYEKFTRLLGVTGRVIRGYLGALGKFFLVGRKDGNYWITPLKKVYKSKAPTDMELYAGHMTCVACRRNRVRDYTEKEFRDTSRLVIQLAAQYDGRLKGAVGRRFLDAVHESVIRKNERIPDKYKWNRVLQPKFINKLIHGGRKGQSGTNE